jgi:glycosyltransferase involved in cell wall biosynthesis
VKAVYVTPSSFRTINAGALRNLSIANSLALGGHEVVILNNDDPQQEIHEGWESLRAPNVVLQNIGLRRSGLISRIRRQAFGPIATPSHFSKADVVIAYNPGPFQYFRIRRLSKLTGVRLILDISEFLSIRDLPGSWLSPYSWLYELFMRLLPLFLRKEGKSLAISRPMADWLTSKGATVLEVPPLSLAVPGAREEASTTKRIVLGGSGLLKDGKDSDALSLLLELAETSPEVLDGFAFQILGHLDANISRRLASIGQKVKFIGGGWMEWGESIQLVGRADWLIQLRDPKRRRNRLGFPSKVTESLSLGTPVIVNKCGGIADYLVAGQNAIVVENLTTSSLADALVTSRSASIPGPDIRFRPGAWTNRLSAFIFEK